VSARPPREGARTPPTRRPARTSAMGGRPTRAAGSRTARPASAQVVARIGARRPVRSRRPSTLGRSQVRLRAVVLSVTVLVALLGGRLVWLQGLQSTAYAAEAERSRLRTTVLAATRGTITDRWGHPLSQDVDARTIFADPSLIADADADAAALAPLLHVAPAALVAQMHRPGRYAVLATGVDVPTAHQVAGLHLPGIADARTSQRQHPLGTLAAQLVGVTQAAGPGVSGVEASADALLRGRAGSLAEEVDPAGRVIPSGIRHEVAAVDGSEVKLTIDRDLQWQAQTLLEQEVAASKARGGDAIVLDPVSGDILAIASAPGFDAAQWPHVDRGRLQLPAVSDVYEPGSVNKVITAAELLEHHVASPSTGVTVPGTYKYPGRPGLVHDAEVHGTEHLTFTGVLAQSSNIGTDILAQELGNQQLYAGLRAFGLGTSTGSGVTGEERGIVPPVATWNPAQASTIPFGQGMAVTALQIASVYATIADGGVRVPPRIVRATTTSGRTSWLPPRPATRVVSAQTATTLTTMLEQVLSDNGTAPKAAVAGYRVAGKTGTASGLTDGRYDGGYVGSFVGFAPADKPRFVVEVVIDHPTAGSHFGGDVAAPIFSQIMAFALREYAVPPTGTRAPQLRLSYDTPASK